MDIKASQNSGKTVHVKSGDTLFKLVKSHDKTLQDKSINSLTQAELKQILGKCDEVAKANGLKDKNTIFAGKDYDFSCLGDNFVSKQNTAVVTGKAKTEEPKPVAPPVVVVPEKIKAEEPKPVATPAVVESEKAKAEEPKPVAPPAVVVPGEKSYKVESEKEYQYGEIPQDATNFSEIAYEGGTSDRFYTMNDGTEIRERYNESNIIQSRDGYGGIRDRSKCNGQVFSQTFKDGQLKEETNWNGAGIRQRSAEYYENGQVKKHTDYNVYRGDPVASFEYQPDGSHYKKTLYKKNFFDQEVTHVYEDKNKNGRFDKDEKSTVRGWND